MSQSFVAEPLSQTNGSAGESAIQFLDLKAQFRSIKDEITRAVLASLESQRFILGPEVEAFEREIAEWNGGGWAVACASGSDALLLALMALEIGPGDEVITTPFTFVATVGSVARLGAKPVFVDIGPETLNIDVRKVAAAITNRTRAIIPVHLFGCPADLDPMMAVARDRNIPIIEDVAQAIGAKYKNVSLGRIGAMGCFSFFPAKNLGCAGDGGLVTSEDSAMADRLRVLRTHGSRKRYSYELVGMNSRLDALQAAILRVKLPHLNAWTEGRRRNAKRYQELFREFGVSDRVSSPKEPDYAYHVYNQFTIRCAERDQLRAHLSASGVPTEVYYPSPLHLQAAFAYLGHKPGDFPEAERACREVVSLPVYPELPAEQQVRIVESIARFYSR